MQQLPRSKYKAAVCACVCIALQPVTGWAATPDDTSPYDLPAQPAPQYRGTPPGNPQAPYPPGYRQPGYGYPQYEHRGYPNRDWNARPGYGPPGYAPAYSGQDSPPPAYDSSAEAPPAALTATPGEPVRGMPTPPAMPAAATPIPLTPPVATTTAVDSAAVVIESGYTATAAEPAVTLPASVVVEPLVATPAPVTEPGKKAGLLERSKAKVEAILSPGESTLPDTE